MRIYIEKGVKDTPVVASSLARFPNARVEYIDAYGDVFHRKNQDFVFQKSQSPVCIFAEKRSGRVVKNPDFCASHTQHNYYYSMSFNCVFNCEYCFLQAQFPSSAFVFFVNTQDYFSDIRSLREELSGSMTFFSSYDNDGIANESFFPTLTETLPFFESLPEVLHEVRTKAGIPERVYAKQTWNNTVFALSVNPQEIIDAYEHKTASLQKRLDSARRALEAGQRVAFRIEPIILFPGWKEAYGRLIEDLIPICQMSFCDSVYYGVLKFPKTMYRKLRSMHPHSSLFAGYLEKGKYDEYTYSPALLEEIKDFFESRLRPIDHITIMTTI